MQFLILKTTHDTQRVSIIYPLGIMGKLSTNRLFEIGMPAGCGQLHCRAGIRSCTKPPPGIRAVLKFVTAILKKIKYPVTYM
jgi:hypothetical protein